MLVVRLGRRTRTNVTGETPKQGTGTEVSDPSRRRTLRAACGAHAVHDGLADALYVLLPVWANAFGLSYVAAGFIKTVFSTAFATLQMPAGMLAERIGSRVLLTLGTVVAGAAFALVALATSYPMLLLFVLLAAIGSTVQHPVASALISRAYEAGARRAALGIYNFSGDVGKMAAASLIGVGATLVGWRSMMIGYGLLVVGVGIAVHLLLAAPRAEPVQERPPPPDALNSAGDGALGFGFTNARGFALLSAIQVIDSAARVGVLAFVPFALIAKGASPAMAGLALTLLFAGGAAGKLVCGLVAERVGILRTVILTEVVTALLIVVAIVEPLHAAMLTLPLLGAALNGTSSVLYGTVAEFVRPERQARAFGLFYSLGSSAGAVAPIVFGSAADRFGITTSLCLVAATVVLAVPLALALKPHLERGAGGTAQHPSISTGA
jgi:FSR family fosmidomycin resistance protein-like MFS transporter